MLSSSQIYSLHQKYSHGKYQKQTVDLIWTHSQIVKEISLDIAAELKNKYQINVDLELLIAGSLIHDLGFYQCFDDDFKRTTAKYIMHSQFGYKICHQEKVPETLSRFCLVHNGVGIYPNIPITLEEEIVTYADCFHSKNYPNYNKIPDIKKSITKYRLEDEIIIDRFQKKFGVPKLSTIKKKYRSWHLKVNRIFKEIKSNQ